MNTHSPNRWVILKFILDNKNDYRVFGGWSGGYLDGDSWRLNSGIASYEIEDEVIRFTGDSGSVYECHKSGEGFTGLMSSILSYWEKDLNYKIEVLTFEEYANDTHSEDR